MSSVGIIFRHELAITVRRKGFVIFTVLVPLITLLVIGVVKFASAASSASGQGGGTPTAVGFVDQAGRFGKYTDQGGVVLRRFATAAAAAQAMFAGRIAEYIVIPADFPATMQVQRFTARKVLLGGDATLGAVGSFLVSNLLDGAVSAEVMRDVQAGPQVTTTRLSPDGSPARDQGGLGNAIIPLVFCLLLVLSLVFSSAYLLQGLVEEKENRLMELLVSRVTPDDLFLGKVLGLGTAGLLQVVVWLCLAPLILRAGAALNGGAAAPITVAPQFYLLAGAFFVLAHFLFATLSASVGAVSTSVREGSQLSALYTLFPVVPLWLMGPFLAFPSHPLWVALSIFPLTAPSMVIERSAVSDIPAGQVAASLLLLAACVAGGVFAGRRIFRTYLLMYGKRPGLGEIVRTVARRKEALS